MVSQRRTKSLNAFSVAEGFFSGLDVLFCLAVSSDSEIEVEHAVTREEMKMVSKPCTWFLARRRC